MLSFIHAHQYGLRESVTAHVLLSCIFHTHDFAASPAQHSSCGLLIYRSSFMYVAFSGDDLSTQQALALARSSMKYILTKEKQYQDAESAKQAS